MTARVAVRGGIAALRRVFPVGIANNRSGVAAVEFAMVAPLFLTLLIGAFDIGQQIYGKIALSAAIDKAARDSALEATNTTLSDAKVASVAKGILPGATITITRKSYYDFADIARAEKWNDTNSNGTCNTGESYVDENGDGNWDSDIGESGNGGANDAVIYTVSATYKPLFRVPLMPASWNTRTIVAATVTKNQPFANQAKYGSSSGIC